MEIISSRRLYNTFTSLIGVIAKNILFSFDITGDYSNVLMVTSQPHVYLIAVN